MKKYFLLGLGLLCVLDIYAQDSLVSLEDYLAYAAKTNPEIQAAYHAYKAALEKAPQVGGLPDPQLSLGVFPLPMRLLPGNQVANIQVMQMFPWFGTLKASRDEATMMAKTKYDILNYKKSKLFFDIKSSWYTLQKIHEEILLVKKSIELLESLEKLSITKLASGDATSSSVMRSSSASSTMPSNPNVSDMGGNMSMGSDNNLNGGQMSQGQMSSMGSSMGSMAGKSSGLPFVLRIKMELLEMKNKMLLLNDQQKTEQVKINALVNRDLTLPVFIQDSLTLLSLGNQNILDSIFNRNPMLSMYANEAASYSLMEAKSKKMGLPMFGVGLNYMIINERSGVDPDMNGMDMFMPMISVSVPLYRGKYKAMQREATLMRQSAEQQQAQLKNTLQVQYQTIIQNMDDAQRRVALYKEQLELAETSLDILTSGLAVSANNYDEVVLMQQKILDYGFKHTEAIIDYNISVAQLEQLMYSITFE